MIFSETGLKGAFLIEPEKSQDERGFFARTFCQKEFEAQGIDFKIAQSSTSFNPKKGTLRGLHYQASPHEEAKLVRCMRGAIYDVIVDLRKQSPTFKRWFSAELSQDNGRMLYVPKGFAHGFQTLRDDTEVFYQMSEFYHPESARGVRWDDPALGIEWPTDGMILSPRDRQYADFVS